MIGSKVMTNEELKAIRERCRRATDGPWLASGGMMIGANIVTPGEALVPPKSIVLYARSMEWDDAVFCAHARQDVPALLDEVARLAAENERLAVRTYWVPVCTNG